MNHQRTLLNEETKVSAYFGATSYKSGLQTLQQMIGANLRYIMSTQHIKMILTLI